MVDAKRTRLMAWLCAMLILAPAACSGDKQAAGARPGKPEHLVELAEAKREALSYSAARAGSLRAVREVKLFNQEEGRVQSLRAREGDAVEENAVLIQLDDRLLRAELDKAEATLHQAKVDMQRLGQLKDKKLVSEDTLTRARTALEIAQANERLLRTRLSYMTLRAPFAGEIAERNVDVGDVAPKHTHLMTIVDPSELVTDVLVSELILPYLHVGDEAKVRIDALGDQVHTGTILRIYPTVDPSTRLGRIEVSLKPVPEGARAGQFCRVELSTGNSRHLVIPFSALRRDPEGEFVYVYTDDATVKRTPVTSGLRLAESVEIRDGLTAGQKVVAKGFLGLADGQKVKPVDGGDGTLRPAEQSRRDNADA